MSAVLFGHFFIYFKGKPCEAYHAPFEIISPFTSKKDIKEK